MHKVSEEFIDTIVWSLALSTQPYKLSSTELADAETTPAENHWNNGASLMLGNQPSLMQLQLTDTPAAPDEPSRTP